MGPFLALIWACASATPRPPLGPELTLVAHSLRISPPAGWVQNAQTDGAVILGPAERLRNPSWIRIGPRAVVSAKASGWVLPLSEQVLHPDPEADLEITRLMGTFADGRARFAVQADVARRAELPAVRASLGSLRGP